ncbi:MAG: hypothetical protein H6839_09810 [Planctomycetes bacterium]|nr:hypothetical protein [Planctomycetota bacterium]
MAEPMIIAEAVLTWFGYLTKAAKQLRAKKATSEPSGHEVNAVLDTLSNGLVAVLTYLQRMRGELLAVDVASFLAGEYGDDQDEPSEGWKLAAEYSLAYLNVLGLVSRTTMATARWRVTDAWLAIGESDEFQGRFSQIVDGVYTAVARERRNYRRTGSTSRVPVEVKERIRRQLDEGDGASTQPRDEPPEGTVSKRRPARG